MATQQSPPQAHQVTPAVQHAGGRPRRPWPPASERPKLNPVLAVIAPLVAVVAVLIAWWIYTNGSSAGAFPTIAKTVKGFWHSLTTASVWSDTWLSWRSLIIGYAISIPIGVVLGISLGASRWLNRALGVYLDIAMVTPMIVLMPIVLIAIGVTPRAEVIVIIFFAVPYVTVPIRDGVRGLPQLWFDLGHSLGAKRWQMFGYILVPASRKPMVRGLRLGFAHAVSGMFTVELTLAAIGIGKVVLTDEAAFKLGDVLGYLALVMVQVLIVMAIVNMFDKDWRRAEA